MDGVTETEAAHELTTRGPAAGQRLGPTARRGTRAWLAATLAIALGLLGVLCVDHGRRTLSVTFDEPNHVAAGLEWWQHGLAAAGMGALVTTQAAADGFCRAPKFSVARLRLAAVPAHEVDMCTSAPAAPAYDVSYAFSNVRVYYTPAAIGTQFAADLT